MKTKAISLKPGSIVGHGGERWMIEKFESLTRVLVARIKDDHREFFNVSDLTPDPELSRNAEDVQTSSEEDDIPAPRKGQWRPPAKRVSRAVPPEHERTDEEKEELDLAIEKFQFLKRLLEEPRQQRASMLEQEYCQKYSCSRATAFRHMRIARTHDSADALLHAQRDDRGAWRLSEEILAVIDDQIKKHRLIKTPKPMPAILERVNGTLRKIGLKEVSLSALYTRLGMISVKNQLKAQGRKKQVRDQFHPKAGHLPNNDAPLAIIQVDHTPMQVIVVDEVDRMPVDKPQLTLVIDCYSRMVLGFYITFDAPSATSTGMALARAFLPKERFLQDINVQGEWPCWGLPDVILVDNAAELNGRMMHSARRRYRFDLRDRPVGAPNFGGHVESAFKNFMFEFKSIPGTTFANPVERAEYDAEGNAILTLRELEWYFTEFLVNDYHLREHRGDGMDGRSPLQRYEHGVHAQDVFPPAGLPDIPADPDTLRISLMPYETRVVTQATVEINGHKYYSNDLKLISDERDPDAPTSQRKFEVRFDPRDLSCIWVWNPATQLYVKAVNTNRSLGSISLWEWRARKKKQKGLTDVYEDRRYESALRRDEFIESQRKLTKSARKEAEKRKDRAANSLVRQLEPAAPESKPSPSEPTRPSLSQDRLAAMRDKVKISGGKK